MDSLPRSLAPPSLVAQLRDLIASDGTAAHRYCAPAARGDRQSFVGDLVDFADFVHIVTILHGHVPGLVDHVAEHTAEPAARDWLERTLGAFALEREYLGRLSVAVGPPPSTAGHHQTSTILAQQRHAVEMLARSDRRGCALGTAIAMVGEWQAIRTILDAGAIRLGIEPPLRRLPNCTETDAMAEALPDPERLSRALLFGATQLLGQHRGMWDLLEARAEVRRASV